MVKLAMIGGFLVVLSFFTRGNVIHLVGFDLNILDVLSQKAVEVLEWFMYFGDMFLMSGQARIWILAMLVTVISYIQWKIFSFIFSPLFKS